MDGLRALPDNCVQCTVTSPPYFALRDYGVEGQIELEATSEEFIDTMVRVFREVRRVTRGDGVLWLNLGDSYSGSSSSKGAVVNKNSMSAGTGQDAGYRDKPLGIVPGYKAKDLMGIPWRVAFALQADGWYFRSAMPWIKRNCMPESTTDRPTSAIEYIFLMTKSARYFYDGEAIRVPSSDSYQNDARPQGVLRQKVNKRSKYPNEGQFKKQDQTGNPTYTGFNERWKEKTKEQAAYGPARDGFNRAGDRNGDQATRNYRNSDPFFESWQGLYSECENPLAFVINPQSRPELHFATFPDLLAATCIKAGTSEYGCCPKCGAPYQRIVECSGGTTGKSWHPHADDGVTGQIGGMPTEGYARQFKGWQPGCKCLQCSSCKIIYPDNPNTDHAIQGSGKSKRVPKRMGEKEISEGFEIPGKDQNNEEKIPEDLRVVRGTVHGSNGNEPILQSKVLNKMDVVQRESEPIPERAPINDHISGGLQTVQLQREGDNQRGICENSQPISQDGEQTGVHNGTPHGDVRLSETGDLLVGKRASHKRRQTGQQDRESPSPEQYGSQPLPTANMPALREAICPVCGGKLTPLERVPCLVLDPFMGSGTVAVVARELNRSSVGCELNPAYVEIIKKRLNAGSQLDTGVVSYRFEKVSGTAGTNSKVR